MAEPQIDQVVTFNPHSCDPIGEGEALAEAITDSVHEEDQRAIAVMLSAAEWLGAEILIMDEDDDHVATKLYENDEWRRRLKVALVQAEAWITENKRAVQPVL